MLEIPKEITLTRIALKGFFRNASTIPSIEPELNLFRKVLDRALIDTFSRNKSIRKEAEDWLDLNNPDFIESCDRALLEPETVYRCFKLLKEKLTGSRGRLRAFGEKKRENNE